MGRLDGKVAIITGGASGIGRASAMLFAREGARVAVADVDRDGGGTVAAAITSEGGVATFIPCDVIDAEDAVRLARATIDRFRQIDVLFNNAGIAGVGSVEETDEALWDRVMEVNVKGMFLVTKAVAPYMIERRRGVIINMASSIAFVGLARRVSYAASKGAVMSMTLSMAVDFAKHNIRVNAICPGTIHTPFVDRYLRDFYADPEQGLEEISRRQLMGRLGTAEDVANAALYLASDEAAFMTGAPLIIDGGLSGTK
ncbi:MAG: glucose 1-dehydrogenase [Armatimonadetes bacterium]|nr:glucose 1-dehydrogenase [Armatimonadota bacterium]MBI2972472.1 glucose 1-dehydrogenase [Armatimonadota bacterium]